MDFYFNLNGLGRPLVEFCSRICELPSNFFIAYTTFF